MRLLWGTLLFCFIINKACSYGKTRFRRLYNSQPALPTKHFVQIWYRPNADRPDQMIHAGGGTIIDQNYMISAAHVFETDGRDVKKFILKYDSLLRRQGKPLKLVYKYIHDDYRLQSATDDLAMIKISKENGEPVEKEFILKRSGINESRSQLVKLSGFGAHEKGLGDYPIVPYKLRSLTMKVRGYEDPFFIVTYGETDNGDSGGGLTWYEKGDEVLGGVFVGDFEYTANPGVRYASHIRTAPYEEWITSIINGKKKHEEFF